MTATDKFYYHRHLPHYQPLDAIFFVTFRLTGSLPAAVIEKMRIDRQLKKRRIEDIGNRKNRADEWHEFNNEYFSRFDGLLDRNENGSLWLQDPRIATVVQDAIHHRDKREYDLIAYCIMPNHVHMVFEVNTENGVGRADCPTTDAGVRRAAESISNDVGRAAESISNDVGRNDIPTYNSPPLFRIMQSLKRYTAREANRILNRNGAFWQDESYDHVVRDDNDLSRIVDYVLMNPVSAGLVDSYGKWPWVYLKTL
jgi:putative transposase